MAYVVEKIKEAKDVDSEQRVAPFPFTKEESEADLSTNVEKQFIELVYWIGRRHKVKVVSSPSSTHQPQPSSSPSDGYEPMEEQDCESEEPLEEQWKRLFSPCGSPSAPTSSPIKPSCYAQGWSFGGPL